MVPSEAGRGEPVFDLRVEDHGDPVSELTRLTAARRAYRRVDEGDELAASGDFDGDLAHYSAAHEAQPGNPELAFWHGVALAAQGREEEARGLLEEAYRDRDGWRELLRRLPAAGLFPDDQALVDRLAWPVFHDRAKIHVRAGGGGNGVVSFRLARRTCPRVVPTAATAVAAVTW